MNLKKILGIASATTLAMVLAGCGPTNGDNRSYNVISQELIFDATGTVVDGVSVKDIIATDSGLTYLGMSFSNGGFVVLNENNQTSYIHIVSGESGRSLALTNDGKTLYMSSTRYSGDDDLFTIFAFDTEDGYTQKQKYALPGDTWAPSIALNSDSSKLYGVGYNGKFTETNLTTNKVKEITITDWVNNGNVNMTSGKLSSDGTKLYFGGENFWITDIDGSNAVMIDVNDSYVEQVTISKDDTRAYIAGGTILSNRFLHIVDLTNNTIISSVDLTQSEDWSSWGAFRGLAVTSDKSKLFVTNKNDPDALFIIDLANDNVITDVNITATNRECVPDALELTDDESALYVGCSSGDVVKFNLD